MKFQVIETFMFLLKSQYVIKVLIILKGLIEKPWKFRMKNFKFATLEKNLATFLPLKRGIQRAAS